MDRKFVIALSSLASGLMLGNVHAIGLGDIRLRSSLNEPLRAEIKLVQVKDLSENQIIVNLASADDFAKAHVDRDFMLNSLRFRLDMDDPNNPKVVVTTQQPIREPFLNFLVEVQWPSGRLLREYTLLMDLPTYSRTPVPDSIDEPVAEERTPPKPKPARVAPPPSPKPSAPRVQPPAASAPAHEEKPAAPAPKPEESKPEKEKPVSDTTAASGDTYGPTRTNDTLWRIAQGVHGKGSVQQKILAIQRLNPGAFSNNNVNLLKTGKVLKLPSQEEIASIGRTEALAKMEEQQTAWKTGAKLPPPTGAQMDATGRAQQPVAAAPQPEGQLTLATPAPAGESSSKAAKGTGDQNATEMAGLQDSLAVGMEELNRVQRENQEIVSRIKDLDAQKESAEKLLQLQNGELAALQAKLAAEQQAKAEADAQAKAAADAQAAAQAKAAADAEAAARAAAASQPPPATEVQPAESPVTMPAAATPADTTPAGTVSQPATAEPVPAATTTAGTEAPAQSESVAVTPSTTPMAPQPAEEQSIIDMLMGNPVIAGAVAVVLILLGLIGYRRKATSRSPAQAMDEDEQEELTFPAFVDEAAVDEHEVAEDVVGEQHDTMAWDAGSVADDVAAETAPQEQQQAESGDVLGEADIYISFGNFDKGESLLKSAIGAEPMRIDYRLKLLELYKEAGNLSAFDEAYKDLIDLDDDVAIAKAGTLRAAIPAAADTPFAFGVSSAAAAAGITDDLDFDLDLDLDMPAEQDAVEVHDIAAPALDDGFGLDLQAVPEDVPAPEVAEVVAEEESGFFDMDFDLDAGTESPNQTSIREAITVDNAEETEAVPEEEFSLDFDLDLDMPAAEAEIELPEDSITPAPVAEYTAEESAMLDAVTADAGEIDEELGFLSDADEAATKLDLARAYIDMGDKDGARDILAEVLEEGRDEQKREAQALLDSIG